MLISIEPGIDIPGGVGYCHSDAVLIRETGYIRLTDAPDTLEELTLAPFRQAHQVYLTD